MGGARRSARAGIVDETDALPWSVAPAGAERDCLKTLNRHQKGSENTIETPSPKIKTRHIANVEASISLMGSFETVSERRALPLPSRGDRSLLTHF